MGESVDENIINKVTLMIGPIEAIPTRPKLLFLAFFPPLTVATPVPNAKINGTVADPVVTPPESKINGKKTLLSFLSLTVRTTKIRIIKVKA